MKNLNNLNVQELDIQEAIVIDGGFAPTGTLLLPGTLTLPDSSTTLNTDDWKFW